MKKSRLESFSDAILAVAITIIVLGMDMPHKYSSNEFFFIVQEVISYGGSFFFIAIYWLKHHYLFELVSTVNRSILKANLNFLFWISILPFATSWIDESNLEASPLILYSSILFVSGCSFKLLEYLVIKNERENSDFQLSFKKDIKGFVILGLNFCACYCLLLLYCWLYPIRDIKKLNKLCILQMN